MSGELEARLARAGRRRHRALAAALVTADGIETATWAQEQEIDEHSLFEIGSLTKPITGTLLALMSVEGEIGIDDPISDHLPDDWLPSWRDRPPTLGELATHRAALPNVPAGLSLRELAYVGGLRERDPWAGLDLEAYRSAVKRTPVRKAPGGRPGYSSLGYGLLGEALAARAGLPYEELLTARVLAPLGMQETWVEIPARRRERLLAGHSRRGGPRPPLEDLMPAAGSLRSTAADMALFLEACLLPPDGRLGEAIALAQHPRARISRSHAIGLGWLLRKPRRGPAVTWHNGGTWGFRSFAGFAPSTQTGLVVLSNSARSVDRLGMALLREGRPRRPYS